MNKSLFLVLSVVVALLAVSFWNPLFGQRTVGSYAKENRTVGQDLEDVQKLTTDKNEFLEMYYSEGLKSPEVVQALKADWQIVCVYSTGKDGSYRKVILKRDRK